MQGSIRTHSSNVQLVVERRHHIASCAARLFTQKGYARTSVREVAKACDMNIGTLYYYVGSKEDILHLVATEGMAAFTQDVDEIAGREGWTSMAEALTETLKEMYRVTDELQDHIVFVYQETRNMPPRTRNNVFGQSEHFRSSIEKLLVKGCENGEFQIEDIPLAAHNIEVLMHMWAFRRWSLRKDHTLEDYTRKQTEFVLKAIGIRA